jgi:hypothetical protein
MDRNSPPSPVLPEFRDAAVRSGMFKVSSKPLAQLTGLSERTVRSVLIGRPGVAGPEAVARVRAALGLPTEGEAQG